MSFKVVRNAAGAVVAFGPNDESYEPGCAFAVEDAIPVLVDTAADKLAKLDADNTLTQRNLREFILLTVKAVQEINPALDLTQIPGVAKVVQVEAQAAALRAQL